MDLALLQIDETEVREEQRRSTRLVLDAVNSALQESLASSGTKRSLSPPLPAAAAAAAAATAAAAAAKRPKMMSALEDVSEDESSEEGDEAAV